MSLYEGFSSFVPSVATVISRAVSYLLAKVISVHSLPMSQGSQVRYALRILVHWLGTPLCAVLHHGPSTVLAPLLPCALLCHSAVLCMLRPRHIHIAASSQVADCSCVAHNRGLELLVLQSFGVWLAMDQGEVSQGAVDEDVGLLLVSIIMVLPFLVSWLTSVRLL